MIDLHSHILPSIDDGAKDIQMSLAMAKQAVEAGVKKMVCTPHIHQGYFDNSVNSISSSYEQFAECLKQENIPLKIAFAAELRICPEIIQWVGNKSVPFIGKWKGRDALMLELPHSHVPPGSDNLIRWLVANSVQPIVVHPERNRDIIADYSKLSMLKQAGAIFQVTAGAFCGRFSEKVEETAIRLLMEDKIAFIASDTHNVDRRPNDMELCNHKLIDLVGNEHAYRLLQQTPDIITKDLLWI